MISEKEMNMKDIFKKIGRASLVVIIAAAIAGCAGMSNTEQRMLSGGAIGAAGGAALGAIGGNAALGAVAGGAAGVVGGVIVDQYEKSKGNP